MAVKFTFTTFVIKQQLCPCGIVNMVVYMLCCTHTVFIHSQYLEYHGLLSNTPTSRFSVALSSCWALTGRAGDVLTLRLILRTLHHFIFAFLQLRVRQHTNIERGKQSISQLFQSFTERCNSYTCEIFSHDDWGLSLVLKFQWRVMFDICVTPLFNRELQLNQSNLDMTSCGPVFSMSEN